MKYLVDIKDTSYAIVEVEADSREQAEEIAYGRYYEGTVEWQDCDIEVEARKAERTAEREAKKAAKATKAAKVADTDEVEF